MATFIYKNYGVVAPNTPSAEEGSFWEWTTKTFDYDAGKTYHTLKPWPDKVIDESGTGLIEGGYAFFCYLYNCYKVEYSEKNEDGSNKIEYLLPGDRITRNYATISLALVVEDIVINGDIDPNNQTIAFASSTNLFYKD